GRARRDGTPGQTVVATLVATVLRPEAASPSTLGDRIVRRLPGIELRCGTRIVAGERRKTRVGGLGDPHREGATVVDGNSGRLRGPDRGMADHHESDERCQ